MKPDVDLKNYETGLARFDSLMPHRVKDMLLVSSMYDSFILEEDGQLAQLISGQYVELNLSSAPHLKKCTTGQEALEVLHKHHFDLIIVVRRMNDIELADFCSRAREIIPHLPIILLAFQEQEMAAVTLELEQGAIDRAFIWNGDIRILLAIAKHIEDYLNVENDTRAVGVRVIILIEDSVKFYSSYLPLIYAELVRQTQGLMADGLNPSHKLLRMRARPKILLAHTYDDGKALFEKYQSYLLGVISDIKYPRGGFSDDAAGLKFARMAKEKISDLPILLQSSNLKNAELAAECGVSFLHKNSPTLLNDLRSFILNNFGFGDFVFRHPDGTEIARAADFHSMVKCIETVDERSLLFHGSRNHFSNWLMARTEFDLADTLRPRQVSEFKDAAELRKYLLETFRSFQHERQLGVVADFSRQQFDRQAEFVRIGDGSLGGKGRGLAFINTLLNRYNICNFYEGVSIAVPPSAVIGTSVFDEFLDKNNLYSFVLGDHTDREIARAFAEGIFPPETSHDLESYLEVIDYPLAVRSSSLLEDSYYQPFAGIYDTHMLPNCYPGKKGRLERLEMAIKYIYASAYFHNARSYIEATGNRIEEEKMAVVLQKAVGSRKGNFFYPTLSGIARSYNFYPLGEIKPEEGVAYLALGLGKTIVEGGNCLYFSPSRPNSMPQFATPRDFLNNSQKDFFAIDMSDPSVYPAPGGESGLIRLGLMQAETDRTISLVGSTYLPDDDRVQDGVSRAGVRIVTFAPILKGKLFPLDAIIRFLLQLGSTAMNCPVEIEFAAELATLPKKECDFSFLQIRPMAKDTHFQDISLENIDRQKIICRSEQSLSNGRIVDIQDIVFIRPDSFDRAYMPLMADQVGEFNRTLKAKKKPYLLIGPGRWGTSDRWLGIPVSWDQISSARVIVEAEYGDFSVTPSFGTHFFQNIISSNIGYLTIHGVDKNSFIDWNWLSRQNVSSETEYLRHVTLENPIEVLIDGRIGRAIIIRAS
jgi:CheY-like chemotaxis protein